MHFFPGMVITNRVHVHVHCGIMSIAALMLLVDMHSRHHKLAALCMFQLRVHQPIIGFSEKRLFQKF